MHLAPPPLELSPPRCVWPAGALLGEGPLWSPAQQSLYWVDILGNSLHRWTPVTQTRRSWEFDDNICAVAERRHDDGLIVTLRRGFALFDPERGELTRLLEPEPELRGNRFNDGKCDATGRFWAGSMDFDCTAPTGSLYRYDPDGRCTRIDGGYAVSNGPAFSRDGRTLYHTDTNAGVIHAYPLDPASGAVGERRVFARFDTARGYPDGMTTDSEGNLWVALFGGGQVVRLDPQGQVVARIPLPCSDVTSCAFGGPDFATLYITTARYYLDPARLAAQPLAGGLFAVEIPGVCGSPPGQFAG